MSRRILITGSGGHLGRALWDAFYANGDSVVGVDHPHMKEAWQLDLDEPIRHEGYIDFFKNEMRPDIVICNAKVRSWESHQFFATCARQCIINIASIYGVLGPDPAMYDGTEIEPTPAWYAASKGAMIALTKWQATTLAPVRSNAIILGGIFRGHSDLFRERYEAKVPLRRMATEQDAVNAVLFLASEKASYITGACLTVDGGYSAW